MTDWITYICDICKHVVQCVEVPSIKICSSCRTDIKKDKEKKERMNNNKRKEPIIDDTDND
jgi:hypothetical protein